MPSIENAKSWTGNDTSCVNAKANIMVAVTIDNRLISGRVVRVCMTPFYHAGVIDSDHSLPKYAEIN